MDWPESDKLAAFRSEVEAPLPEPLSLRDISKHPDAEAHRQPGRYDPDTSVIWVNRAYSGLQRVSVVSHELARAWQYARKYPRARPLYVPRDVPEDNRNLSEVIYRACTLTDRISDLVLDPAADRVVFARGIVQKDMVPLPMPKISTEGFTWFDSVVFYRELSRLPDRIRDNAVVEASPYWLRYGLGAATNACVLAAAMLRMTEAGRFHRVAIQAYDLYPGVIKRVSDWLMEIVRDNDIGTQAGCQNALETVLKRLGIPDSVVEVW